jgi:hypothetical protein
MAGEGGVVLLGCAGFDGVGFGWSGFGWPDFTVPDGVASDFAVLDGAFIGYVLCGAALEVDCGAR